VRKIAVVVCALAAAVLVAVPPARGANASVSIVDYAFQPADVTISVGESVTWMNRGTATHTVSGDGFDSGNLTTGKTYMHAFSQAGSFQYQCNIHTYMKGTVTVQGGGPAPTQPPAPAPTPAPAATAAPRATAAPTTTALTTTSSSSTTTTLASPAAADAGTTTSTTAAAGGGVALGARKTSSGTDSVSPWLAALAGVLVLGAASGSVLLRRRLT
jgi:plastocyanin